MLTPAKRAGHSKAGQEGSVDPNHANPSRAEAILRGGTWRDCVDRNRSLALALHRPDGDAVHDAALEDDVDDHDRCGRQHDAGDEQREAGAGADALERAAIRVFAEEADDVQRNLGLL